MVSDAEFQELKRELRYVQDRLAILDCIANHSRGHDRHDAELMTSVYHDDGVDEHGPVINPASAYAAWANAAHAAFTSVHTHNITTHSCEIDGDVAHAESYVIVCILSADQQSATFASGRYLDRLERRDGQWKIALRRTVNEMTLTGDASWIHSPDHKGYLKGSWGKDDPSYQRPLLLNPGDKRW